MAGLNIPKPSGNEAWAAVAVILKRCQEPMVLVGKRAANPSDPWGGDAAFPGGHYETNDSSLLDTAIRETREETGIDLSKVGKVAAVLGIEHPRNAPELNVLPIVFIVDCNVDAVSLSGEFEYVKWIRLSDIPNLDRVTIVKGNTKRAIVVGDMTIWGMTRRILCKLYNMVKNGELNVNVSAKPLS